MKRIITLVFGRCLLLFATSTCLAQMYTVTDLGPLGKGGGEVHDINAAGQIAGAQLVMSDGCAHAFRTGPNSAINLETDDLGSLGGICGGALGINALGQAVGYSILSDNVTSHAFRTAPNSRINPETDDLGTLGGTESGAWDINASGQVTGGSTLAGDTCFHAFRTGPNRAINVGTDDLGTLGNSDSCASNASAINASGQVVGESFVNGLLRAYRTSPNSRINPTTDDLGSLGGDITEAAHINDIGQVVGQSMTTGNATMHPYRTAPNRAINPASDDLGTLPGGTYGTALHVNSYGEVVGQSETGIGPNVAHAFIYSSGGMYDLNNLIPVSFTFSLVTAYGINDAGQILVEGWDPYPQNSAFLLTPIYKAFVQQPINADGSSVFSVKRGVIPVKFAVTQYGTQPSCSLPATIGIVRAGNGTLASVDEATYAMRADSGLNFRIDPTACQYIYNLAASSLGVGTYRVDISINGIMVGHAVFALK